MRLRILAMKGKLDIGQKLFELSRAMLLFFGTGVTVAVLSFYYTPYTKQNIYV